MIFLTYFLINLGLAISPGPDILFVFTQSLQYHWRLGMTVVLGLCSGLIIHMLFALFGLSTLLLSSPNTLFTLQIVGAMYLCYLACQSLMAYRKEQGIELPSLSHKQDRHIINEQVNFKKFYLRGLIMNLTNPKVLLFFIAVLPQFINPQSSQFGVVMQTLIFGCLSVLASFICFSTVVLLVSQVAGYLNRYTSVLGHIHLCSALILFSLAGYLVLSHYLQ